MKKKVKIHYSSIFAVIFIITSIYLIQSILLFNKIETLIRYIIIGIIALIDILILAKMFLTTNKKKKKKKRYVYSGVLIVFSILFIFLGYNLNKIYSYFSELNKKVVYSTSLVSLKENKEVNLSTLKDKKIGISSDGDIENLSEDIIKKYSLDKNNKMVDYESDSKMILDLYNKEIDYAFLPTNFVDVYSSREEFEDIGSKLVVVDTTKKEVTKEEVHLSGSSKDVSEPFTVLLIGIDSTVSGLQHADSFNGDSLIVVTFNPSTMSATMLSIPRDSYVPISCMKNVDNKITHSAANGTKCVINTIQNFLDIKIDYYMKINFTGVVDLVNALDGIEVDVPYDMCEQDSHRRFEEHIIYINKGRQILDGEKALAFARNRKSNSQYCAKKWTYGERSDFIRSEHQQEVIQAILDRMKNFSSINDLEKVLDVISKNFDTNMSEDTILSFYNIAKDVLISSSSDKVLSIQKLYLDGTGQMIYDERSGLVLWDYILNTKSVNAVKKAMKDNLSGVEPQLIKSFSYKLGEKYEPTVIGKGYYGTVKYKLVKNLVGMKYSEAQTWANQNGVKLNPKYVVDKNKSNGTIISQNYPESKRIDLISDKTITLKVVKNDTSTPTTTKVDCTKDELNKACIVPDFVGKTYDEYLAWANGFSNMIKTDKSSYVESSSKKPGTIIEQTVPQGTTVKEMIDKNLSMSFIVAKEKSSSESGGEESGNTGESSGNTGESSGSKEEGSGGSSSSSGNEESTEIQAPSQERNEPSLNP